MDFKKILKNKMTIIGLAALITLAVVFLIVLPTGKKIKNISLEIYQQRVALEKLYLRGQSIKVAQRNYEKVKDELKILDNIFNQQGQELEFITAFEKIALLNNVKQIIDIQDSQGNKNNYQSVRVDLTLQGTFPDIIKYLDNIQTLDFYFNIDSLNLYYPQASSFKQKPGQAGEGMEQEFKKNNFNPTINASVSGLTYWK